MKKCDAENVFVKSLRLFMTCLWLQFLHSFRDPIHKTKGRLLWRPLLTTTTTIIASTSLTTTTKHSKTLKRQQQQQNYFIEREQQI